MARIVYSLNTGMPQMSGQVHELIEKAIGPDTGLLILDNLSTLAPSMQENEADAWAPIQTWILKLRKMGLSVLLIHHAGKTGRQRGTSRREDAFDSVIMLKHSDSYGLSEEASFEVHIEKARGFLVKMQNHLSLVLNLMIREYCAG